MTNGEISCVWWSSWWVSGWVGGPLLNFCQRVLVEPSQIGSQPKWLRHVFLPVLLSKPITANQLCRLQFFHQSQECVIWVLISSTSKSLEINSPHTTVGLKHADELSHWGVFSPRPIIMVPCCAICWPQPDAHAHSSTAKKGPEYAHSVCILLNNNEVSAYFWLSVCFYELFFVVQTLFIIIYMLSILHPYVDFSGQQDKTWVSWWCVTGSDPGQHGIVDEVKFLDSHLDFHLWLIFNAWGLIPYLSAT